MLFNKFGVLADVVRVVLECFVLAVELIPNDLGNGWLVGALLVDVAAVVLLTVFLEEVWKMEL